MDTNNHGGHFSKRRRDEEDSDGDYDDFGPELSPPRHEGGAPGPSANRLAWAASETDRQDEGGGGGRQKLDGAGVKAHKSRRRFAHPAEQREKWWQRWDERAEGAQTKLPGSVAPIEDAFRSFHAAEDDNLATNTMNSYRGVGHMSAVIPKTKNCPGQERDEDSSCQDITAVQSTTVRSIQFSLKGKKGPKTKRFNLDLQTVQDIACLLSGGTSKDPCCPFRDLSERGKCDCCALNCQENSKCSRRRSKACWDNTEDRENFFVQRSKLECLQDVAGVSCGRNFHNLMKRQYERGLSDLSARGSSSSGSAESVDAVMRHDYPWNCSSHRKEEGSVRWDDNSDCSESATAARQCSPKQSVLKSSTAFHRDGTVKDHCSDMYQTFSPKPSGSLEDYQTRRRSLHTNQKQACPKRRPRRCKKEDERPNACDISFHAHGIHIRACFPEAMCIPACGQGTQSLHEPSNNQSNPPSVNNAISDTPSSIQNTTLNRQSTCPSFPACMPSCGNPCQPTSHASNNTCIPKPSCPSHHSPAKHIPQASSPCDSRAQKGELQCQSQTHTCQQPSQEICSPDSARYHSECQPPATRSQEPVCEAFHAARSSPVNKANPKKFDPSSVCQPRSPQCYLRAPTCHSPNYKSESPACKPCDYVCPSVCDTQPPTCKPCETTCSVQRDMCEPCKSMCEPEKPYYSLNEPINNPCLPAQKHLNDKEDVCKERKCLDGYHFTTRPDQDSSGRFDKSLYMLDTPTDNISYPSACVADLSTGVCESPTLRERCTTNKYNTGTKGFTKSNACVSLPSHCQDKDNWGKNEDKTTKSAHEHCVSQTEPRCGTYISSKTKETVDDTNTSDSKDPCAHPRKQEPCVTHSLPKAKDTNTLGKVCESAPPNNRCSPVRTHDQCGACIPPCSKANTKDSSSLDRPSPCNTDAQKTTCNDICKREDSGACSRSICSPSPCSPTRNKTNFQSEYPTCERRASPARSPYRSPCKTPPPFSDDLKDVPFCMPYRPADVCTDNDRASSCNDLCVKRRQKQCGTALIQRATPNKGMLTDFLSHSPEPYASIVRPVPKKRVTNNPNRRKEEKTDENRYKVLDLGSESSAFSKWNLKDNDVVLHVQTSERGMRQEACNKTELRSTCSSGVEKLENIANMKTRAGLARSLPSLDHPLQFERVTHSGDSSLITPEILEDRELIGDFESSTRPESQPIGSPNAPDCEVKDSKGDKVLSNNVSEHDSAHACRLESQERAIESVSINERNLHQPPPQELPRSVPYTFTSDFRSLGFKMSGSRQRAAVRSNVKKGPNVSFPCSPINKRIRQKTFRAKKKNAGPSSPNRKSRINMIRSSNNEINKCAKSITEYPSLKIIRCNTRYISRSPASKPTQTHLTIIKEKKSASKRLLRNKTFIVKTPQIIRPPTITSSSAPETNAMMSDAGAFQRAGPKVKDTLWSVPVLPGADQRQERGQFCIDGNTHEPIVKGKPIVSLSELKGMACVSKLKPKFAASRKDSSDATDMVFTKQPSETRPSTDDEVKLLLKRNVTEVSNQQRPSYIDLDKRKSADVAIGDTGLCFKHTDAIVTDLNDYGQYAKSNICYDMTSCSKAGLNQLLIMGPSLEGFNTATSCFCVKGSQAPSAFSSSVITRLAFPSIGSGQCTDSTRAAAGEGSSSAGTCGPCTPTLVPKQENLTQRREDRSSPKWNQDTCVFRSCRDLPEAKFGECTEGATEPETTRKSNIYSPCRDPYHEINTIQTEHGGGRNPFYQNDSQSSCSRSPSAAHGASPASSKHRTGSALCRHNKRSSRSNRGNVSGKSSASVKSKRCKIPRSDSARKSTKCPAYSHCSKSASSASDLSLSPSNTEQDCTWTGSQGPSPCAHCCNDTDKTKESASCRESSWQGYTQESPPRSGIASPVVITTSGTSEEVSSTYYNRSCRCCPPDDKPESPTISHGDLRCLNQSKSSNKCPVTCCCSECIELYVKKQPDKTAGPGNRPTLWDSPRVESVPDPSKNDTQGRDPHSAPDEKVREVWQKLYSKPSKQGEVKQRHTEQKIMESRQHRQSNRSQQKTAYGGKNNSAGCCQNQKGKNDTCNAGEGNCPNCKCQKQERPQIVSCEKDEVCSSCCRMPDSAHSKALPQVNGKEKKCTCCQTRRDCSCENYRRSNEGCQCSQAVDTGQRMTGCLKHVQNNVSKYCCCQCNGRRVRYQNPCKKTERDPCRRGKPSISCSRCCKEVCACSYCVCGRPSFKPYNTRVKTCRKRYRHFKKSPSQKKVSCSRCTYSSSDYSLSCGCSDCSTDSSTCHGGAISAHSDGERLEKIMQICSGIISVYAKARDEFFNSETANKMSRAPRSESDCAPHILNLRKCKRRARSRGRASQSSSTSRSSRRGSCKLKICPKISQRQKCKRRTISKEPTSPSLSSSKSSSRDSPKRKRKLKLKKSAFSDSDTSPKSATKQSKRLSAKKKKRKRTPSTSSVSSVSFASSIDRAKKKKEKKRRKKAKKASGEKSRSSSRHRSSEPASDSDSPRAADASDRKHSRSIKVKNAKKRTSELDPPPKSKVTQTKERQNAQNQHKISGAISDQKDRLLELEQNIDHDIMEKICFPQGCPLQTSSSPERRCSSYMNCTNADTHPKGSRNRQQIVRCREQSPDLSRSLCSILTESPPRPHRNWARCSYMPSRREAPSTSLQSYKFSNYRSRMVREFPPDRDHMFQSPRKNDVHRQCELSYRRVSSRICEGSGRKCDTWYMPAKCNVSRTLNSQVSMQSGRQTCPEKKPGELSSTSTNYKRDSERDSKQSLNSTNGLSSQPASGTSAYDRGYSMRQTIRVAANAWPLDMSKEDLDKRVSTTKRSTHTVKEPSAKELPQNVSAESFNKRIGTSEKSIQSINDPSKETSTQQTREQHSEDMPPRLSTESFGKRLGSKENSKTSANSPSKLTSKPLNKEEEDTGDLPQILSPEFFDNRINSKTSVNDRSTLVATVQKEIDTKEFHGSLTTEYFINRLSTPRYSKPCSNCPSRANSTDQVNRRDTGVYRSFSTEHLINRLSSPRYSRPCSNCPSRANSKEKVNEQDSKRPCWETNTCGNNTTQSSKVFSIGSSISQRKINNLKLPHNKCSTRLDIRKGVAKKLKLKTHRKGAAHSSYTMQPEGHNSPRHKMDRSEAYKEDSTRSSLSEGEICLSEKDNKQKASPKNTHLDLKSQNYKSMVASLKTGAADLDMKWKDSKAKDTLTKVSNSQSASNHQSAKSDNGDTGLGLNMRTEKLSTLTSELEADKIACQTRNEGCPVKSLRKDSILPDPKYHKPQNGHLHRIYKSEKMMGNSGTDKDSRLENQPLRPVRSLDTIDETSAENNQSLSNNNSYGSCVDLCKQTNSVLSANKTYLKKLNNMAKGRDEHLTLVSIASVNTNQLLSKLTSPSDKTVFVTDSSSTDVRQTVNENDGEIKRRKSPHLDASGQFKARHITVVPKEHVNPVRNAQSSECCAKMKPTSPFCDSPKLRDSSKNAKITASEQSLAMLCGEMKRQDDRLSLKLITNSSLDSTQLLPETILPPTMLKEGSFFNLEASSQLNMIDVYESVSDIPKGETTMQNGSLTLNSISNCSVDSNQSLCKTTLVPIKTILKKDTFTSLEALSQNNIIAVCDSVVHTPKSILIVQDGNLSLDSISNCSIDSNQVITNTALPQVKTMLKRETFIRLEPSSRRNNTETNESILEVSGVVSAVQGEQLPLESISNCSADSNQCFFKAPSPPGKSLFVKEPQPLNINRSIIKNGNEDIITGDESHQPIVSDRYKAQCITVLPKSPNIPTSKSQSLNRSVSAVPQVYNADEERSANVRCNEIEPKISCTTMGQQSLPNFTSTSKEWQDSCKAAQGPYPLSTKGPSKNQIEDEDFIIDLE